MKLSMNSRTSMRKLKSGKDVTVRKIKGGFSSLRRIKKLQKGTRKSTVGGVPEAISFEGNAADGKKEENALEEKAADPVMEVLGNKASEMSVSSAEEEPEREPSPVKEMEREPSPVKEMETEEAKPETEAEAEPTDEDVAPATEEATEETTEETEASPALEEEAPAAEEAPVAEAEVEAKEEEKEAEAPKEAEEDVFSPEPGIETVQQDNSVAIGFCEAAPAEEVVTEIAEEVAEESMMAEGLAAISGAAEKVRTAKCMNYFVVKMKHSIASLTPHLPQ